MKEYRFKSGYTITATEELADCKSPFEDGHQIGRVNVFKVFFKGELIGETWDYDKAHDIMMKHQKNK